jgi:aerobic-type carbon monoxide dehydrogenase small subunit (CoxS/CutS family)
VELVVNGTSYRYDGATGRTLLALLRDDLDLVGAKYGCGEGRCGACMVLIDGVPTPSCIFPAGAAAGKQVRTIEGLAANGQLHPLQEAFLEEEAFQCGYCTPGMIMSGVALLAENPAPTRQEIVAFMDDNVCRCGTHPRIVRAIESAATRLREERP